MQILPCAFEFNERFLLVLHDHVYSAQFGTFIGNCQKDRIDLRLSDRTYSFWGFVKVHEAEYRNALYRKDSTPDFMKPTLLPQNIKFWRGMYNRFENGVHPREPVGDILAATLEHTISLEDHSEFLTKRISWMKEEIKKYKESKTDKIVNCDNRLINDKILQNGDIFKPNSTSGVLNMQEVEESLVSAGALPSGNNEPNPLGISPQGRPSLTETSPEKLTIEINDVEAYPVKSILCNYVSPSVSSVLTPLLSSLALDWKSFRHIRECSCSTPFDHFSRKSVYFSQNLTSHWVLSVTDSSSVQ
ncbi:Myotubularin-related protein 8 [Armadillidium nasatum]|uniref:Myotubularin-related protein 8 n=1 Tax=Armadillidium nasatum TaxID=96803 RepID=A0A5N5TLG7_9CRUS|nr:Myotubularin-related protein 8 [Armadillidium nasatum]